jgi:hypothetical protein
MLWSAWPIMSIVAWPATVRGGPKTLADGACRSARSGVFSVRPGVSLSPGTAPTSGHCLPASVPPPDVDPPVPGDDDLARLNLTPAPEAGEQHAAGAQILSSDRPRDREPVGRRIRVAAKVGPGAEGGKRKCIGTPRRSGYAGPRHCGQPRCMGCILCAGPLYRGRWRAGQKPGADMVDDGCQAFVGSDLTVVARDGRVCVARREVGRLPDVSSPRENPGGRTK